MRLMVVIIPLSLVTLTTFQGQSNSIRPMQKFRGTYFGQILPDPVQTLCCVLFIHGLVHAYDILQLVSWCIFLTQQDCKGSF